MNRDDLWNLLGLLCLTGLLILAWTLTGNAQSTFDAPGAPVCLYHPETILKYQPAGKPIISHARPAGYLQPVDSVSYLQSLSKLTGFGVAYEQAAVAVQYSLKASPLRLGAVPLRNYLTTVENLSVVPPVSLQQALQYYQFTANPQQRATWGHWLLMAVNDPINRPCNPWRAY